MKQKIFSQSILLNGEYYFLQSYQVFHLKNLLVYFSHKQDLVVLERNGKILNTQSWAVTKLASLDRLETITIVGGG
jgi:thiamine biosynthesis protein ThiS